ncbi:MAG: alpha-amylase [Tepidisphaeraceae bacterium]
MSRGVMMQYFEWNLKPDGTLWKEIAERAQELRDAGITAVWLPPPYKGMGGQNDVGYAVYDLYDLGEFDQKGSVPTKYGTKDEFVAAVTRLHDVGVHAYVDTVLNHRMGGDEKQKVTVREVDQNDRNRTVSEPYEMHAWARYTFPGRGEKYSSFKPTADHFNAFGANADKPDERGKIYLQEGHTFSGEVDFEFGNFDYLMGADVNHYHPEVRDDLIHWADWMIELTNVEGFRLDAVKHIPASFYKEWFEAVRTKHPGRELFGVGEYWSADLGELQKYIEQTEGTMTLFDVPLHFHFHEAGQKGRDYDLSQIFEGTLVQTNPLLATTFVENHDSQPGQSLQSPVMDWFKPFAYALILLRRDGYPCIFYGDYYGNDSEENKLISHRVLIDLFLKCRGEFCFGEQQDYLDHPQCIAWYWSGDDSHPGAMAVIMSTGDGGEKIIDTGRPGATFRDRTGHITADVKAGEDGKAVFTCPPGGLSVWCTI